MIPNLFYRLQAAFLCEALRDIKPTDARLSAQVSAYLFPVQYRFRQGIPVVAQGQQEKRRVLPQ